MKQQRKRNRRGVTLIEMLVVVAIMALFGALVAPRMFNRFAASKATAARTQIGNFMSALGMYKLDTSVWPTTEQGLAALRTQPQGVATWKGPYLPQDIPKDPWGNDYVYKYPGEHGDEPDIISYGADGQPGGEELNGDVVSWKSQ